MIKKLPETDEERLDILRAIIDKDDVARNVDKVLNDYELQSLRNFVSSYEASVQFIAQARGDEKKAYETYKQNMNTAKMYISHFIQVLLMTVQRNEIKTENLILYGFAENVDPKLPDLVGRDAVLKWGENIIKGEAERIGRGGFPIYNPAIAIVKVHYEIFKESIFSLDIFRKNLSRLHGNMKDYQSKANSMIVEIWDKVEEKFSEAPLPVQTAKYRDYKVNSLYQGGEQLDVFG